MHHYHVHTMQLQDVATLNWSLLGKLHGETYFAKPAMSGMPNCAGVVKQWSMLIIICIIFLHQHDNQPFRIVRPVHSFAERRHSSILPNFGTLVWVGCGSIHCSTNALFLVTYKFKTYSVRISILCSYHVYLVLQYIDNWYDIWHMMFGWTYIVPPTMTPPYGPISPGCWLYDSSMEPI